MKVKVGDKVRILAGKDRGKEGKVILTLKKRDKVVVEGINIVKKHMKPNAMNETGGILSVEAPIHVSNVKVIDSKDAKSVTKASATKKETVKKEEKPAKKTAAKKTTTKKSTKKEVGEK